MELLHRGWTGGLLLHLKLALPQALLLHLIENFTRNAIARIAVAVTGRNRCHCGCLAARVFVVPWIDAKPRSVKLRLLRPHCGCNRRRLVHHWHGGIAREEHNADRHVG